MKNLYSGKMQLMQYSALSAGLIGTLSSSNAQIIYHDVVPDDTINAYDNPYRIDLNNDGIIDFGVVAGTGGDGTLAAFIKYNSIAGKEVNRWSHKPFAFKLNPSDYIGISDEWVTTSSKIFLLVGYYGFWKGGVTDGFVGLRIHPNGSVYYGWLRLDVSEIGDRIIVKDYAYNSVSDSGLTIPKGIPTSVETFPDGQNISIFPNPANDILFISGLANRQSEVLIYDLEGKCLLKQMVSSNTKSNVNVSFLANSNYFIDLKTDSGSIKKMFSIQH